MGEHGDLAWQALTDAARSRLEAAELAEVNTTTGGGLRRFSTGQQLWPNTCLELAVPHHDERHEGEGVLARVSRPHPWIRSTERPATSHLDALVLEFQPVHLDI